MARRRTVQIDEGSLRRTMKRLEEGGQMGSEDALRSLILELSSRMIQRCPVQYGYARGSLLAVFDEAGGDGSYPPPPDDPSPDSPRQIDETQVSSGRSLGFLEVQAGRNPGAVFGSRVGYIGYLDEGLSDQAPEGMTGPAIDEVFGTDSYKIITKRSVVTAINDARRRTA